MEKDVTLDKALDLPQRMLAYLIELAPTAATILLVLALGVMLAWISKRVAKWAVERLGLDALAERAGAAKLLYAVGVQSGLAEITGKVVFWGIILVTLHSAASLMGIPNLTALFDVAVGYLPSVFGALFILVAGVLGGDVVRRLLGALLRKRNDVESPELVGRFVYYIIVIISVTMAIKELGLEIELIDSIIQIATAAAGLGFAIAFGLGARETFRNLIARFYVSRLFRVGDQVSAAGKTGVIVAFSPTAVLIQHERQEWTIPYVIFMSEAVALTRIKGDPGEAETPPEDNEAASG